VWNNSSIVGLVTVSNEACGYTPAQLPADRSSLFELLQNFVRNRAGQVHKQLLNITAEQHWNEHNDPQGLALMGNDADVGP